MFNRKTATAPAETTAELIVTEAISQIATDEASEVEVQKIPTGMTAKKATAAAKAAAKKAGTSTTAIAATEAAPATIATVEAPSPFASDTRTAILNIAPAKKDHSKGRG